MYKVLFLTILTSLFTVINSNAQNYFSQIPFLDSAFIYTMDINESGDLFVSAGFQNKQRNGIYRSTNNGQTWDFILSYAPYQNAGIDINNEGAIYAIADWGPEGTLYKSIDNGQTWNVKSVPLDIYWTNDEIFCRGADTLFISQSGGSPFRLIRSFDDGINWDTVFFRNQSAAESIMDIVFGSEGEMFMAISGFFEGEGGLYKSTDYGTTWSLFGLEGLMVQDLSYNSTGDLFISTMHYEFGGLYVVFANEQTTNHFYSLTDFTSIVINSSDDIFAGQFYYPGVYHSADNGLNYNWITSGLGAPPENMFIDSEEYIYATNASRIWRSNQSTITLTKLISTDDFTIYPNPCKSVLLGDFKIGTSKAKYEIIDLSGRIIISGFITHDKFRYDVSNLKPGIYCLKLISEKSYSKIFIKE